MTRIDAEAKLRALQVLEPSVGADEWFVRKNADGQWAVVKTIKVCEPALARSR